MKIEITVYKDNGKWYTSDVVEAAQEIPMFKEEFKEFIKKHNPANIKCGFITTKDLGDGFHDALWRYDEIYQ